MIQFKKRILAFFLFSSFQPDDMSPIQAIIKSKITKAMTIAFMKDIIPFSTVEFQLKKLTKILESVLLMSTLLKLDLEVTSLLLFQENTQYNCAGILMNMNATSA
jgi:hypothetical protein